MNTGSLGTFVISWAQTEIDGVPSAPITLLTVGATWRFSGQALRLDGAQHVYVLGAAPGSEELRRRAARGVRRLVGAALGIRAVDTIDDPQDHDEDLDHTFVVTDGMQAYTLTLITVQGTGARLLMAMGSVPPVDQDLWIVRAPLESAPLGAQKDAMGGVICFTPETMIATESGPCAISQLRAGDRILTRDNGPQPILWRGHRRMSGARLHVMPHLRPIRFLDGAMGMGRPDKDLLVSPQHRMLVRGPAAMALFNTPEVLVAARDLVNDRTIMADRVLREVTYIHILLERHNIVWANGLESESFHPSDAALEEVAQDQRLDLFAVLPQLAENPGAYGDHARRNVSAVEAVILRHEMGH